MTLKQVIRRFAPAYAGAVSAARTELHLLRSSAVMTPYGFRLRGSAHQASGMFEHDEIEFITDALSDAEMFIDVGANIGLYTCLSAGAGVRTVAIEPNPVNARFLCLNVLENGLDNVEVVIAALSTQPGGVGSLYGGGTAASLIPGWAGNTGRNPVLVPLTSLDRLHAGWKDTGGHVVVKIDVEGAELDLLRGGSSFLGREGRTTLLIEINLQEHHPEGTNPAFADVFALLWEKGYKSATLHEGNKIGPDQVHEWVRGDAEPPVDRNFIFRRLP